MSVFRYGLTKNERACATLANWEEGSRHGFAVAPSFNPKILVREVDILYPNGLYYIPTDDISKDMKVGDVIDCMVIESRDGLIAIGGRKDDAFCSEVGTYVEDDSWQRVTFPRFMGVVSHYNFDKSFGFIRSDTLRKEAFFQKRELLVPHDTVMSPYEAMLFKVREGDMVTFDLIETPRGLRALAVKKWKGEENGG